MALAITISLALVLVTALIHYEGLRLVSRRWRASDATQIRRKVLLAICWVFLIHH